MEYYSHIRIAINMEVTTDSGRTQHTPNLHLQSYLPDSRFAPFFFAFPEIPLTLNCIKAHYSCYHLLHFFSFHTSFSVDVQAQGIRRHASVLLLLFVLILFKAQVFFAPLLDCFTMVDHGKAKSDLSFAGTFACSAFAACFAEVYSFFFLHMQFQLPRFICYVQASSCVRFFLVDFVVCTANQVRETGCSFRI